MVGKPREGRITRPPTGDILKALANQHFTWFEVLAELIDNSFDAEAKHVEIEMYPKRFGITDDGVGCKDPALLVVLGERQAHSKTRLGRFGIGSKDAVLWIASHEGRVHIATTYKGMRRALSVDFADYAHQWQLDLPEENQSTLRGTSIEIPNPYRTYQHIEQLKEKLMFYYAPGLQDGLQIVLRTGSSSKPQTDVLHPYVYAEFDTVIEDTLDINGKIAQLRVGITQENAINKYPGLAYQYEWRVIRRADRGEGCDGVSTARIFGTIRLLGDGWGLTKNKDNINDAEALYAAVQERCAPLYKQARDLSEKVTLDGLSPTLSAELTDMFVGILEPTKKARRGSRKEKTGTIEPKDTNRKHLHAADKQEGKSFPEQSCNSIRVSWLKMGPDKFGEFSNWEVKLNVDLPRIALWRDSGNHDTLLLSAATLIADYCANNDRGQTLLLAPCGKMLEILATLLNGPCVDREAITLIKKASA